jgi:hypothetical protein
MAQLLVNWVKKTDINFFSFMTQTKSVCRVNWSLFWWWHWSANQLLEMGK